MQQQQTTLPHRTISTAQKVSNSNANTSSSAAAPVRPINPAVPVTPIVPSPTSSAGAGSEDHRHMSVRDFNVGEVKEWLRRGTTSNITSTSPSSASTNAKPTSPAWASKPSITAAGQDFWMLLRRQVYALESGVSTTGGSSSSTASRG